MREPWLVPASYAQERVWFASQVAPDAPIYHVGTIIRMAYPLTEAQARGVLATLTERHEPLRTGLRLVDGALTQVVYPRIALPVEVVDLSGVPEEERRARVKARYDEESVRPIPLDTPPLWRALLARAGGEGWWLVFTAHHAIYDGGSEVNLRAEISELCAAAAQGRPARLPDLPIQYADYAVWQREQLAGGRLDELLEYWRKTLADLPAVHRLPTDHPRPARRTFGGGAEPFTLAPDLVAGVAGYARQCGATPFLVLLTGYVALLRRLTGHDDVVVGVPVAGRDLPELQPLIGMFVNMVVLRVEAGGDPRFGELLDRVRAVALAAWDHQDMPYQKLVEELAAHRDPGVPPLYQLGFNYIQIGFDVAGAAEDDMMLEVADGPARLAYNRALFEPATARALTDGYQGILAAALGDPDVRLSALPVAARSPAAHGGTSGAAAADAATAAQPAAFVAPRGEAQELVADVWAEVLDVPRVGAFDDFFDLGGHSLLALRVIARLSAATGVDLPIQEFFADTTLAAVAAAVERLLLAELDGMDEAEAARLAGEEGSR
jgi:hypothetical protein